MLCAADGSRGSSGKSTCQLQGCERCGWRALVRRALAPQLSLAAALVHAPGSCARLRSCAARLRPKRTLRGVCGALAVHVPCGLSAWLFWTSDVAYPASRHQLPQHPARLGCINAFSGRTSRIGCGSAVGSRVGAAVCELILQDWVGESTFGLRNGHLKPQSAQFFPRRGLKR